MGSPIHDMCLQTWDLDGPRLVPTILLDTRGSIMMTMMMEKRTLRKRQLSTRKSTMMMGRKRMWQLNLQLLHLFLLQGIDDEYQQQEEAATHFRHLCQ